MAAAAPRGSAAESGKAAAGAAGSGRVRPAECGLRAMHLRLLVLLALLVLGEPVAEPRLQPTRERTANKPVVSLPKPLISPLVSLLLVNRELHGRDQRHHWVRTVAALHPAWRVAAGALLVAWLAAHTGWGDNTCTALRVTGVVACAAILQYGVAIAIATSVLTLLVLTYIHDERAEARDYGLTELDLAAAASGAAYAPVGQRISEMRERGIESTNWIEDKSLSTEVRCATTPGTQPRRAARIAARRQCRSFS